VGSGDGQQFGTPPEGRSGDAFDLTGFQGPEEAVFDEEAATSGASILERDLAEAFSLGVDPDLTKARNQLADFLRTSPAQAEGVQPYLEGARRPGDALEGVGLGASGPEDGGVPGEPRLVLFVSEPVRGRSFVEALADDAEAAALTAQDLPIEIVYTGRIDALPHRSSMRPAPGGISAGHYLVGAGTLGCLCTGLTAPRDERLLALSNNHVFAAVNAGSFKDSIRQPGPADGGTSTNSEIGVLERFVPINFAASATNYVDCATAWVDPKKVRAHLLRATSTGPNFLRVSSHPRPAADNLTVGKSGRTTGVTRGYVQAVGITQRVYFPKRGAAVFDDQISVVGTGGRFSAPGDSGSLVWTWDQSRDPVGLLFAGATQGGVDVTFVNPIDHVLSALDIRLVV